MLKQAKDKNKQRIKIVASAMSELKGARATASCCGRGQMSNELLPMLPATRSMYIYIYMYIYTYVCLWYINVNLGTYTHIHTLFQILLS